MKQTLGCPGFTLSIRDEGNPELLGYNICSRYAIMYGLDKRVIFLSPFPFCIYLLVLPHHNGVTPVFKDLQQVTSNYKGVSHDCFIFQHTCNFDLFFIYIFPPSLSSFPLLCYYLGQVNEFFCLKVFEFSVYCSISSSLSLYICLPISWNFEFHLLSLHLFVSLHFQLLPYLFPYILSVSFYPGIKDKDTGSTIYYNILGICTYFGNKRFHDLPTVLCLFFFILFIYEGDCFN